MACAVAPSAHAQPAEYPHRPIRLLVPSAPGASIDGAARVVANGLAQAFGQPVVTDNRPGAGGTIAAGMVARAAPDGYTLFLPFAGHVLAPFLNKNLPYSVEKDFAAITQVGVTPLLLVVHASVNANSVRELVALAKAKPGGLTMSFSQIGTATHLAAELFRLKTGTSKMILSVPYKGGAASQIALLSGEVQLSSATPASMIPHIKSGKVRALAVSGQQRSRYLPDIPTFEEQGVPGMDVAVWQGVLAPTGTPRPIINRLHAETVRLLKQPESIARLSAHGIDPVGSTPEEFHAKILRESNEFGKIIRSLGMALQ